MGIKQWRNKIGVREIYLNLALFLTMFFIGIVALDMMFGKISQKYVTLVIAFFASLNGVIAIAFADKTKKEMNLILRIKNKDKPSGPNGYKRYSFELENKSITPLCDFSVIFRFPKKMRDPLGNVQYQNYKCFKYDEFEIVYNDDVVFLGNESIENRVGFYHSLDIDRWEKGTIIVTINAKNYKTSTFIINVNKANLMMKSSDSAPLKIPSC